MDITELLLKAMTLLGLGMTFVFMFLGLLMIAIKLLAMFVHADQPTVATKPVQKAIKPQSSDIDPKVVAAISSAVMQYRKRTTA
ncbi:OadG family transporter subunit [Psychromonas sp. PT13]|uniref:OadG family transporter subunit n=1 Tax=Psychromonas sp. PT13 TaxID=3439547 RepID=UPI003EBD0E90